ncbi:ABC transporter permease [Mesorhizobium retamae]|uniref:ABC transporter permease n=1 Tax=Mesorhizobium retamae TaxID=2912854 RepID=A0ABS9QM34_9HYPH|nr:ABC transporter permease [Mesorhizobium sp. IRAMC:0171]MCG7508507.1 ABC transporter permease [Mesorhizobium sp. IRAMC:0171]
MTFLVVRLARALLTILIVVSFAFVVLRLSGDPALAILTNEAPPEALLAFRQSWGLDEPILVQYFNYLRTIFSGDLGMSMRDGRDAFTVVAERIPITLAITVPALMLSIMIGVTAGICAAFNPNSRLDRSIMLGAVAGFTVPSFVLGLLLVLVFSVWFGVLPSGGAQRWTNAILPIVTLGVGSAATLARYTRAALLEVLDRPYVRTASAKGVPWWQTILCHALPNAAIPMVTILGFLVGQLIAGAVVVENVFSWPGVGRLLVASVASRDLAVVQCLLFFVAATMIAANIATDILYSLFDPRLRASANRGGA